MIYRIYIINIEDQILTLKGFTHWKAPALGGYLSCRGLSSARNKQEIVAQAYPAHVMKTPPKKTASDIHNLENKCYSNILKFKNCFIVIKLMGKTTLN